jgi:putative membrane protein
LEGFLGNAYLWVKAAHLIFVIFWIAGLFILPRYYVYHHAVAPGTREDALWIEREARLRKIILSPALSAVWILGWMLALNIGALHMGWFHAKLALVIALTGYHGWAVGFGRKLARGERPGSNLTLRLMNEVPAIATAVIVVLAIVKPF